MVSSAIRQTYTYYSPEEPTGRVVKNAPLAGRGKAWTLGDYKHPVYPSPLNVLVGDAGIHVWFVVQWLRQLGGDKQALLARYGQVLRPEDVDVALWFYDRYREEIDQKLAGVA